MLNQAESATLETWVDKHLAGCIACGAKNFQAGERIEGHSVSPSGWKTGVGTSSVPMVQVICGTCAYVHLFAAIPMGLAK